MLVSLACKIQELEGQGGFHSDFTGAWKIKRVAYKRQFAKLWEWSQKCWREPRKSEMPRLWNICYGKLRPWVEPSWEGGCMGCNHQCHKVRPMELTLYHRVLWVPDMEPQDFNACPAGFLFYFGPILFYPLVLLFLNGIVYPVPFVFWHSATCFWLYRSSQIRGCLESQKKRLWFGLYKNAGERLLCFQL